MTTLCLAALRPFLRISSRWPRNFQRDPQPLVLPYELWSEICRMLSDDTALVAVSVSRALNAHAIPIYLARHGISLADLDCGTFIIPGREDVFLVLRTAFFLPPVRKLSCAVFAHNALQIIPHLSLFLSQQTTLEDVDLTFYPRDLFLGCGPLCGPATKKKITQRVMQREVCRLLNFATPAGKTLVITPDKSLLSGKGGLWHIVQLTVVPPRGSDAKVRKAAGPVKERKSRTDVVLNTIGKIHGTTCRDLLVLDVLHSFHAKYVVSPEDWAVVVLNAYSVRCLNLTPALAATDWSLILPLLDLPSLRELTMGRKTVYAAQPELHDIGTAELNAFLTRHKNVERLEYLPELSPRNNSESLGFPLASLRHITYLTTTPVHSLHLQRAHGPKSFPMSLVDLVLLATASTPVARAAAKFMEVLRLLGDTTQTEAPDFAQDVDALAEFLSPFEPGLRWVKFQPIPRCTLEYMGGGCFVDRRTQRRVTNAQDQLITWGKRRMGEESNCSTSEHTDFPQEKPATVLSLTEVEQDMPSLHFGEIQAHAYYLDCVDTENRRSQILNPRSGQKFQGIQSRCQQPSF
ncbi:hypothetical protein B0H19DRAFT_1295925 [Mycena capillaripes]|nr:hypothetical protein B0H19DRAFT_1295925 [Mycena capillaripes]